MNNELSYMMRILLNNWLNGDIINDFYLFETFVSISKLLDNIHIN